jgi:hypothetical protein
MGHLSLEEGRNEKEPDGWLFGLKSGLLGFWQTVKNDAWTLLNKAVGASLAIQVFLFQVILLTKARLLYHLLRADFFIGLAMALALLVRRLTRQKFLWLVLALVLLVRVPFYIHPVGMVTTSDNAVDALGAAEIRDAHSAPFFLLNAVKHMGTIKQFWVAFLWDVAGRNSYLYYLLVQLVVFLGFLLAWDAFLEKAVPTNVRLLLLALNFAFIEVVFDYSLSIRGAPYLEMAFFFLAGAALFDPSGWNKGRLFLAYYFIFFAVYIHPLAAVLAGSFCLCAAIYALAGKKFWLNLGAAAAGLLAGLFHWFYYLAFVPKPVAGGAWETIGFMPFGLINKAWLLEYLHTLKMTFLNIFDFEFNYLSGPLFHGPWKLALIIINRAMIILGFFCLIAALVLSARALWPVARRRRAVEPEIMPHLFFLILLAAVLAKCFLFYPPHLEPRHNFDAVVLIVLSFFLTGGAVLRIRTILSWKGILAIILGLAIATPHFLAYYDQAVVKDRAYHELLSVLYRNQAKVVDTDFILAYCIYFLSDRRILATDAIGPFQVKDFYPQMRKTIEGMALDRKTYIFYTDRYPQAKWHRKQTKSLQARILNRLGQAGIQYKIVELADYVLIIPHRQWPTPGGPTK